jgi:hypothetical protein
MTFRGIRNAIIVLGTVGAGVYLALPPTESCACLGPSVYRLSMKSELRNTMAAQTAFRADSGRFAATVDELGLNILSVIRVRLDSVTPRGYRARAEYTGSPDGDLGGCALWFGDSALAIPTVPEGEPRCYYAKPTWRFGTDGARWRT